MKLSKEKVKIIKDVIKNSVKLIFENDFVLLKNNTHEQDISHRFAHYMENSLNNYLWFRQSQLSVDVEYNRDIADTKTIDNENCRPDIIIHERLTHKNNVIVIEIKKDSEYDRVDFERLKKFTKISEENPYKYQIGLYLSFSTNDKKATYVYFKNGEQKENGYIK